MKKRLVSVLLVMALLVPTVTACHDSSKDSQATKDVQATGYDPEEAAKKLANYPMKIRTTPSKWVTTTATIWSALSLVKRLVFTKL